MQQWGVQRTEGRAGCCRDRCATPSNPPPKGLDAPMLTQLKNKFVIAVAGDEIVLGYVALLTESVMRGTGLMMQLLASQ